MIELRTPKNALMLTTLAAVAAVSFGLFVWPTAYRYEHMSTGGSALLVRINRLSGKTAVLSAREGWLDLASSAKPIPPLEPASSAKPIPPEALSRVHAAFEVRRPESYDFSATDRLEAEVQNDSTWTLDRIVVNADFGRVEWVPTTRPVPPESKNPPTPKDGNQELLDSWNNTTTRAAVRSRQYVLSRIEGTGKPGTSSRFSAAIDESIVEGHYLFMKATLAGGEGEQ